MFIRNIHVNADQLHNPATFSSNLSVEGGRYDNFPVLNVGRGTFVADLSILSGIDGIERGHYRHSVHIGNYCSLAGGLLFILDQDHPITHILVGGHGGILPVLDPDRAKGEINLQNDVWVGYGVTVMNGVRIHNGACVAAGSHVVKDVPPYTVVGGNPAQVIRQRFPDKQIADLLQISWWNWSEELLSQRKEDFQLPVEAFIEKYLPAPHTQERRCEKLTYLFLGTLPSPTRFGNRYYASILRSMAATLPSD